MEIYENCDSDKFHFMQVCSGISFENDGTLFISMKGSGFLGPHLDFAIPLKDIENYYN